LVLAFGVRTPHPQPVISIFLIFKRKLFLKTTISDFGQNSQAEFNDTIQNTIPEEIQQLLPRQKHDYYRFRSIPIKPENEPFLSYFGIALLSRRTS
jgi:hypothetical protein